MHDSPCDASYLSEPTKTAPVSTAQIKPILSA